MQTLRLTRTEIDEPQPLLSEVTAQYDTVEDANFLAQATIYAQELPRKVRAFFGTFKLAEPSGICLVSGYPIDDTEIGRTPSSWESKPIPSPTLKEEVFFFLCGSLLGEPIGWSTQQDGYILHDVLPIKGHEKKQLGTGSEEVLTWHTEDAFIHIVETISP
jgi:hypothetical protein